jgi:hypothetical protein
VTNDFVAAAMTGGYSAVDQAVSELSATGAASRPFLVAMAPVYSALLIAFGAGVRMAARGVRRLRITGDLLMAFGVFGLLWLPFPMSPRDELVGASISSNDVGHIVMTIASVSLICACIIGGSAASGRTFAVYSWSTIVATLLFGGLTGVLSGNLDKGEPTPWMGLVERISMGAWFVWLAVFAIVLLRQDYASRPRAKSTPATAGTTQ